MMDRIISVQKELFQQCWHYFVLNVVFYSMQDSWVF